MPFLNAEIKFLSIDSYYNTNFLNYFISYVFSITILN